MRKNIGDLDKYRVMNEFGLKSQMGELTGFYKIPCGGVHLRVIAFNPEDAKNDPSVPKQHLEWEHVSVTVYNSTYTPTWVQMCFIKALFWEDDECVVQFHPPKSSYVNHHPGCLHLWRKASGNMELPPIECV